MQFFYNRLRLAVPHSLFQSVSLDVHDGVYGTIVQDMGFASQLAQGDGRYLYAWKSRMLLEWAEMLSKPHLHWFSGHAIH